MSEGQIVETPEKDRKQSDSSDTEYDPQFKPIITLPEVEVSTNEENERELLKIRAKLYRFDSSSDPPEWKERGTGELKLLVHNVSRSVRVVMRRDKTLKVCANHFITPYMELKPSAGSDKAFVYTVFVDFADEKPKSECLAVKFGTIDNAALFKSKFEEAQNIVATECDLYNGKGEQYLGNTSEEGEDNDESKDNASDSGECEEVTIKIRELEVSKTEDE
ncbi:ran-specific GTPase-activating protein [Leptinotarsa decemlineata]|uniref:ran-specific GTPase-activating protein n=1 Tax=Leptinotarsa decemlineata TaxID=7539 RepID=UPI000C252615|nr:ran-specific GTPase-activating protein-like [Leptinotarsa decemlineata]